ncbi:mucin-3A-like [Corvus hawaiiensis]|uniref:mucin-3A-like n=1 Tax=Corvus hawaiiensis TaxID=134902 RepID=UPI00201A009C|nr:mucin-3A-like [Corvus hawaiiensis]
MTGTDLGHKVPVASGSGSVAPVAPAPPGSAEDGAGWRHLHPPPPLHPSEALSAPCANGGTAVGDSCVCPPGRSGRRCETPDPASACQNGGTAVGTACYCPPGFGGPQCQHSDPGSACRNGATAFGTTCVCPPGFHGDACQDVEEPGSCLNGGTLEKGTCRCPPTAWGPRCECTGMILTTAGGMVLYVNDTTGTNGTVTATTTESTTDKPLVRRARNVTARPAEGNATTVGNVTTATTVEGDGTVMGRNVTVTTTESDTRVSASTDDDVNANTNNCLITITTTASTNTDDDVIANTDNDVITTTTTVSANTDHDVITTTERDTVHRRSVTMATTPESNTTTTLPARRVRNVTASPMGSPTRATTMEGETTAMEGDTTVTPSNLVEGETTAMEGETTPMEDETTVMEGDTEATPMEGDTEATPVATMVSNTRTTTVESDTVTMLPGHLESHSRAITRTRNTTAAENNTRATTVESDTTAVPMTIVGGHTRATENNTRATTVESDTTAVPMTIVGSHTRATENNTRATTVESDTTAVPMTIVGSHTRAMENNTRATTVESDTTAVPMTIVGSHTRAMENNTRATTVESDTTAVPMTIVGSHTRAMENNTRATTVESDTTAVPMTIVGSHTRAMENNTRATTVESDTTAVPMTIVGSHTRAMENNTRATTVESDTTATPLKSNTRATTLESHTPSTLPTAPADVISMPVQPNATHTIADATETTAVTPQAPPNTTEATGALGHISTRTTGEILTSAATSTVTTMATICLYLPHGSSPPLIVCHNGGVANRTHCLCPPGYSGPTCETPNPSDRCAGGSTAVGDHCICPPGRVGPRCATPDPATACRHGGTAVGTECYCPPGFSGPRCEDPRPTTVPLETPLNQMRTAPQSTRRTTTTTIPTTRDPCLNGGRWMGMRCLCPPNVNGPRCEFGASTINLTAELGPFVMMMARVTNRDFSEDMGDTSSPGHRRFAEEFSRTMDGIYRNVSDYRGIRVLSLSRGSVVVNYRIQLWPLPGNASLEHRALELLAVANTASQPHNCSPSADGLCFTATSARATRPAMLYNYTELCRRHAPANFSRFYFPYRKANEFFCVTNCTLNVPGSFDCHHGFCKLTIEGPQCFCPDLPWYLSAGDRCQTHISKLGLGLGVGLGLGLTILILLILCIVLTVRLAQGRKKSPGASPFTPARLHSAAAEDTWPDGGRNSRVTGIYHVNGRGGGKGPYGHNTYKPSSEVAEPPAPVLAEGAAAL